MKFYVTKKHIQNGVPLDTYQCPVSFAIAEQFPQYQIVVGEKYIHFNQDQEVKLEIKIPTSLRMKVYNYDSGIPMQPFKFELPLPAEFTKNSRTAKRRKLV